MIITVVGGGSTFTPGIVKSIAQRAKELDLDEIRLFDIDKERQDKKKRRQKEENKKSWWVENLKKRQSKQKLRTLKRKKKKKNS